jgi:hypothetical protein
VLELELDDDEEVEPPAPELCEGFAELPHPAASITRPGTA